MRGFCSLALVLSGATTAHAGHSCGLDSSDTVAHGVQAGLAIWAATKRCEGPTLNDAPVKCEQDVASSIEELIEMGTALAGMVGHCGGIKMENADCFKASNEVIAATAGLAAAGGQIADHCAGVGHGKGDVLEEATTLGKCTADAGESMDSFFHAHNAVKSLEKHCDKKKGCTVSALDVTTVLAEFGAYIAAAYTDCSEYADKSASTDASDCADGVLEGVAHLTTLARLALNMKNACASEGSRLYIDSHNEDASATGSPLVLALAAILPISAVLSFVAGSRFAKSRQNHLARDADLLESGSD